MSSPVVAFILAGGTGSRLGSDVPKQLLRLGDKQILAHTLDVFTKCQVVGEIRLFMTAPYVDSAAELVESGGYAKVGEVSAGGDTRAESARRALETLSDRDDGTKVLVHDAVRPLVDVATVAACVSALDDFDACTVAVESTDTVVEVARRGGREVITAIPSRTSLRRCQTPQAFRLGVLRRAHEAAAADPRFAPTDDCGVVHRYLPQVAIGVVPGSERNLKITHPADLHLAEYHLHNRTQ